MCGIIALYVGSDAGSAKERLFRRFEKQKMRGTDSFGVVIYHPDTKAFQRVRTLKQESLENNEGLWKCVHPGDFVMFHHRYATSTEVLAELGHPFLNEKRTISLIHNGVIGNYMEEAEKLMKKGHKFETFHKDEHIITFCGRTWTYGSEDNVNDSEVLLHHYEDCGFDDEFYRFGSLAVVVIDATKDKMLLTRNTSPITCDKFDDGTILFSSEDGKESLGYKEVVSVDTNGVMLTEKAAEVSSLKDWRSGIYGGTYGSGYKYDDEDGVTVTSSVENSFGMCEWCGEKKNEVKSVQALSGSFMLCDSCEKECYSYDHDVKKAAVTVVGGVDDYEDVDSDIPFSLMEQDDANKDGDDYDETSNRSWSVHDNYY